jgi:hypothetical protein
MKKLYYLLFLLVAISFITGFFWNRQTKKTVEVKFNVQSINYGGEDEEYKIESKYPVFTEGLSKDVQEKINLKVKDFITKSVDESKTEFDILSKELIALGSSAKPQYLGNVSVKSDLSKNPFLNVTFEIYAFSGGAHGITMLKTFVFDSKSGEEVSLQEVFTGEYLKTLSILSKEALESKDPNGDIYSFIEEGTTPEPDNFSTYTLEGDGMHITFSDYQVGPYVVGHPEIVISYDKLDGILRPEIKELIK